MATKTIKTKLTADTTEFQRKMRSAKNTMADVGKTMSVGLAAGAAAAAAGIYGVTRAMSSAVEAAGIQERAEAKLGAVLKATGGAAGYNLQQLKAMAGGMQQVTTVGDEVTLSAMSILATFKQVRGEGFERATKAAIDMSAVMGTELNSSILQIGKALNDPIKGLSMLTRVGVTFTDQQREQIHTLQEAGDVYAAQSIILRELETQFGGAGEALRDTFSGAAEAAQNAFGDVQEEMGFLITKNDAVIEGVQFLEAEFVELGTHLQDNRQHYTELAQTMAVKLVGAMGGVVETMRFMHNGWLGLRLVGSAAVQGMASGMELLYDNMRFVLVGFDAIFNAAVKLGAMDTNPLNSLEQGLDDFKYSSASVTKSVLADIESTNKKYDSARQFVEELKDTIASVEVTAKRASEEVAGVADGVAAAAAETTRAYTEKELDAFADSAKGIKDNWQIMHEERDEIQSRALDGMIEDEKDFSQKAGKEFGYFVGRAAENFDDIGGAWESMWKGMLGTASRYLGEIVTEMAFARIGDFLVDSFFHSGAWDLKSDEQRAVLQEGEMVIPKGQAERLRELFPNGGFEGLTNAATAGASLGVLSEQGLKGFMSSGIATALQAALGLNVDPTRSLGVAGANTVSGMVSFGLQDALGAHGPQALMGKTSGMSRLGAFGGRLGGYGALGGFLGKALSPVTSFLGAWGGNFVGDVTNTRGFEGLLDAIEDGRLTAIEAERFAREQTRVGIGAQDPLGGFFDSVSGFLGGVRDAIADTARSVAGAFGGGGGHNVGGARGTSTGTGGGFNDGMGGVTGLATGGILTKPTWLNSTTYGGENGTEGVLPLHDGPDTLRKMHSDIKNSSEIKKLAAEIKKLATVVDRTSFQIAKNTLQTATILQQFNYEGLPQERDY